MQPTRTRTRNNRSSEDDAPKEDTSRSRRNEQEDYDDDAAPPFHNEERIFEGNLGDDPNDISGKRDGSCIVFSVAASWRSYNGEEGTYWIDVKVIGNLAQNLYVDLRKGMRVFVYGQVEGSHFVPKGGDEMVLGRPQVLAKIVGIVPRWSPTSEILEGEGERKPSRSRSRSNGADDSQDVRDENPPRARRSRNTTRQSTSSSGTTRRARTAGDNLDDEL